MDTEIPHESTGPEPVDAGTRAALARLELVVTRRLDGMLLGDHRGLVPGPGTEPGEAREYEAGDDVRSMDWSVTARTTVPHIRQKIADRELETWIVVDLGPSIDVAGSYRTKRELVLAAVATVGFLATGDGARVGMVLAGAGRPRVIPATSGADHVRRLLEDVARAETEPTPAEGDRPARGGLAAALTATRAAARRSGLVVVISDFLPDVDWERALRTLAPRQELLAVHVADPLDLALPVVGSALLQDPATGEVLELSVDSSLAEDYREASAAHRAEVRAALRRCGAPILALRTDRDWVRDVIAFMGIRRLGGMPAGGDLERDLPEGPVPEGAAPDARGGSAFFRLAEGVRGLKNRTRRPSEHREGADHR